MYKPYIAPRIHHEGCKPHLPPHFTIERSKGLSSLLRRRVPSLPHRTVSTLSLYFQLISSSGHLSYGAERGPACWASAGIPCLKCRFASCLLANSGDAVNNDIDYEVSMLAN